MTVYLRLMGAKVPACMDHQRTTIASSRPFSSYFQVISRAPHWDAGGPPAVSAQREQNVEVDPLCQILHLSVLVAGAAARGPSEELEWSGPDKILRAVSEAPKSSWKAFQREMIEVGRWETATNGPRSATRANGNWRRRSDAILAGSVSLLPVWASSILVVLWLQIP